MLGLKAIPSPLYRATVARIAERLPVPEVADHLVCSVCGARNDELKRRDTRGRMPEFQG
jgi:hypothetical protein